MDSQPTGQYGTPYSVDFQSVNQLGAGRYFSGFAPTCAAAEDFSVAQGSGA